MKSRKNLFDKLNQFIRKYYINQLVKGIILSLLGLIVFFIVIAVLEHYIMFDVALRTFFFWLYIALNTAIAFKYIFIPILKLLNFRKGINYKDAAKILGEHFSEINDKLTNILELNEMSGDSELISASIEQKTLEISPVPILSAINFKSALKNSKWLLIPLGFIFILFISGKEDVITKSSERIIKHNKFFEPEAPYNILIETELIGDQFKDYNLKIQIEGAEIPNKFFVRFSNNQFLMTKKSLSSHEFLFKNLADDLKFNIIGGGYKSIDYVIDIIPSPTINRVKTIITPPPYTNKEEEIVNSLEDLELNEGTKVEWIVDFENTDIVYTSFNNEKSIKEIEKSLMTNKVFYKPTQVVFSYKNNFSVSDTINFNVNVTKDEFPKISIDQSKDSVDNIAFFSGIITDDYGLSKLSFIYYIDLNKKSKKIKISRDTEQIFYFQFNFDELNINENQEVKYYFEVWDNDAINGNKKTKSEVYIYTKKSRKENIFAKELINKKIKNSLSKSMNQAKELRKEINNFNKDIIDKKKLSWEDKQKAKEILDKQNKILNEIENNKQNSRLQEKKQSKINSSNLEKQKQLKELMESVIDEELKKLLEEFEQLINEEDKEKLKELLEQLDSQNDNLEKELDRELELFKQLEFEQKTEEIINDLNKLKEKQENLKEETDNKQAKTDDLAKEQELLEKEMEEIKKSLDELKKKNDELENKNQIPETKEEQEEISNLMKQSKNDLEKNKKKSSSKKQDDAIKKLEDLEQSLMSMQQSNSEEAQIENIETLREILENLITLSFNQEELISITQKTKTTNPDFVNLVRKQQKLQDDSKIIEDSLFALSKRVVKIKSKINKEITLIKDNMNYTTSFLEERKTNKASEKQQFVMTSTNNLALLLSEILKSMQMDLSSMPSSCKKPKNCNNPKNSNNPSMSEIKKAQKELNKKMKNGQKNGEKNKGNKKMSSKDLMQLAKKQGLIKSGLENLKNGDNNSEDSKKIEEIKKQMEENEYDIINNKISNTTLERLDQIIDNFIDYEKAKKEEGEEEKRESFEWRIDDKNKSEEIDKILKEKINQVELLNSNPINLKPYYKKEVSKYFNSIIKKKK